ncbi:MAG: filamentous hemagglutinin N-terminal domain-containing protein [bacterium]|nr:filamentous hemagglutinin N-terminal domain-containing protein [bacterium]
MNSSDNRPECSAASRRSERSPGSSAHLRERHGFVRRQVAWLTLFCFFVSPATVAFAGGSTETAVGTASTNDGQFTENTQTQTTFDQSTRRAVVHWDVMDQQADNTLTFVQDAGESVLNQASGVSPSVFRGMVQCGASCVFANEAGVTFADGSFIDVGRLVAVAGALSEDDFRAGDLHAEGITGEVHNFGEIHADSAALIGARITNGGEIYIADGTLTAVVGNEVWLREHDSDVVIHAELPGADYGDHSGDHSGAQFDELPAIDNTGTIEAGSGRVRMLAGDFLSFAIRNQGRIAAREISLEAGEGSLVEVSGAAQLDASNTTAGGTGGAIEVLGDYVAIAGDAALDASGHSGGGEILIGGDRGGAAGTRTAKSTYVGAGTTLRADATHAGDGGKVIVWSDETTRSYGTISARGGVVSGNGGFVETSGLEFLDVLSSPLIHTRSGNAEDRGGEWLLDPFDIDIVASCTGDECLGEELAEDKSYEPALLFAPTVSADSDTATSLIAVDLIKNTLLTGSSVTLTTQGQGSDAGTQLGDIELTAGADLLFASGGALPDTEATLTLLAANDIVINAGITNNDANLTLNLDFRANSGQPEHADEGANQYAYMGDLTTNADIDSGGGSIELRGANVTLNNTIETNGGKVIIVAEGGNANLDALIDTTVADPDELGGNVTVASLTRVTQSPTLEDEDKVYEGDVLVGAAAGVETGGGDISLHAGNRSFTDTGDGSGGSLSIDGDLDSGGGNISLAAVRTVNTSDQGTLHFGGELTIGKDAAVESEGGAIVIESAIDTLAGDRSDNWTSVSVFGEIDSSNPSDADEQGGDVTIQSGGIEFSSIRINDDRDTKTDPMLATNGGLVSVFSGGTVTIEEGSIDTRFTGTVPADEDEIEGEISILSWSESYLRTTDEDIALLADSKVGLFAGLGGGSSLRIETDDPGSGSITIGADELHLSAGDGVGGLTTSQVDLSDADASLQFTNGHDAGDGKANPLALTISQDAALGSDNLPAAAQFDSGAINVEELTFRSYDADVEIASADPITVSDTLLLATRDGISISGTTLSVGSALEIESFDALTVDSSLATALNAATPDKLTITAGSLAGLGNTEEAGLEITSSLTANDALVLHGGAGGTGDVTFASTPTLAAGEITLWAGDGSRSNTTAEVIAVGSGLPSFTLGGATPTFTLRQSASIDDATIPSDLQFTAGVNGVHYTLRSDGGEIGGDDALTASKLRDTFLSLHARTGIDPTFTGGAVTEGTLRVRGLDIGGLDTFSYTRDLNARFNIVDTADTVLVIRAGLSGAGDLSFDGTVTGSDSTFDIRAEEIRLVAGDGLAGAIDSQVLFDDIAGTAPTFAASAGGAVERFVFRQDAAITEDDLPLISEFFDGTSPLTYVIHSDYDRTLDAAALPAIEINDFETLPTASELLILSGEHVVISRTDEENLDLVSDFESATATSFELEIRTDLLDVRADDTNDLTTPVSVTFVGDDLHLSDFARDQTEDELAQLLPTKFDIDNTPSTTPNFISLSQEADVATSTLSAFRNALDLERFSSDEQGLTSHDGPTEDPDESHLILAIESLDGSIALDSAAVQYTDLRLTVRAEDAETDWGRDSGATFALENLLINADHSLVFGDTTVTPTGALDVVSQTTIQINTGNGGSDGDLGFAEQVDLTANQILLHAGVSGVLAGDGESPSVDVTTNTPDFSLVDTAEAGDPPNTLFEIRQDAGFVDDVADRTDGESEIALPSQLDGQDEIGTLRLISEAGSIKIANLSQTFVPFSAATAGSISNLDLQAGGSDPLEQGTITIEDGSAVDTDLTLYDSMELTADEIILAANATGVVKAHDPDVIFREASTGSTGEALRFTVRHEGDLSECASGCADGALPSLDQFDSLTSSRPILYTLESISGLVDLTTQIALKLVSGTNAAPQRVDLTLLGDNSSGTVDVRISADAAGRDADVQLNSLVVGEVNNPLSIELVSVSGETTHVATTEDQIYYGTVAIDGAAALTGDTLHLTDDVSAADEADLTLNVREHLRIDGDIDLVRDGDGTTSSLRINLDPSAADLPRVEFGSDGEGQTVSADRIEIFATAEEDLGETGTFFPDNARDSSVATIGKRSGDLDFRVDHFSMSEGEKLSVGGALTIGDTDTVYAAIGDLSAVTIDVIADRIAIILRQAGEYLGLDGSLASDAGVDFVANTIGFEGSIELSGTGERPSFGVLQPSEADADLAQFPVAGLNTGNVPIQASDFDWTLADAPPDLHPEGAPRDDFSSVYFGKEVVPAPDAWRKDAWLPVDERHVAKLDIALRPDAPRAIRSRLEGAGITDDVGSDLPDRRTSHITVSQSRILTRDTQTVATRYARLFGEDGSRTDEIKQALKAALDDYRASSGARRVLGFEFRRYLRNRPSSQLDAYLALQDLDTLFSYHRDLGLTPGEYNRIQLRWLQAIKPDGISLEELAEAVHPSRYIRGSDILDIFGE